MTTTIVQRAAPPRSRVGVIAWAIARRSLVGMLRIPAAVVPMLAMPIFFVVAFSGSFEGLVDLPGFPTDNILNWMLPFAIMQGSAFAGFGTGFATVRDITTGFYPRLLLSPGTRAPLLIGPVIAGAVRATITVLVVLAFGLALGADLPGGLPGFLALWGASVGIATVATGWALGVVFRLQSIQAGPVLQLGIFFSMFLSNGQVPVGQQTGWVKLVSQLNPITNVLRLARQGFLGDVTWGQSWPGLAALAGMLVVLQAFAARGLPRLTR